MSRSPLALAALALSLVASIATSPPEPDPAAAEASSEPFAIALENGQDAAFHVEVILTGDWADHHVVLTSSARGAALDEGAVVTLENVWENQDADGYGAVEAFTTDGGSIDLLLGGLQRGCDEPTDGPEATRDGDACVVALDVVIGVDGGGPIEADLSFGVAAWENDDGGGDVGVDLVVVPVE